MEYLVNVNKIENIYKFKKYTKNFMVGLDNYSVGMNCYLSVKEIILLAKSNFDSKFFVHFNKLIIGSEIIYVKTLIAPLLDIDNIYLIVTDLGLLNICIDFNKPNKVVMNLENLTTNYYDFNFYKKFNVFGSFISNEVSKKDLSLIIEKKEYFSFYNGFGFIPMFNSRRSHISNFLKVKNRTEKYPDFDYSLKEETRDEHYRVLEEKNSFIIYRPTVFYAENLNDLDYFVLNNVFFSDDEMLEILECIQNNKSFDIETDTGFLEKEIIYKKE